MCSTGNRDILDRAGRDIPSFRQQEDSTLKGICWRFTPLAIVLLLYSSTGFGAVGSRQVYEVPRVDGITIDGSGDDWRNQGFRADIMIGSDGKVRAAGDFDPQFRLAWNDHGLLVLANVTDNAVVVPEKPEAVSGADGIELFVSTQAAGRLRFYQGALALGSDPKSWIGASYFWDFRNSGDKLPKLTCQVAGSRTDGGYRLEALLPWENLGVKPFIGREFGLQIWIYDNDPGRPGWYRGAWFPYGYAFNEPETMHRIRLTNDTSSPPEKVVFSRISNAFGRERFDVFGTQELAGRDVTVMDKDKRLGTCKMASRAGHSVGQLIISSDKLSSDPQVLLWMDKKPVQITCRPSEEDVNPYREISGYLQTKDFAQAIAEIQARAEATLSTLPDGRLKSRHKGMVLYLSELLGRMKTEEKAPANFAPRYTQLRTILDSLDSGIDVLSQQRGTFEWAYYSRVDGSGQPIEIGLPLRYDGRAQIPVVAWLHGSGGNHYFLQPRNGTVPFIALGINGRGNSRYIGIGEADVIDAIDFVTANLSGDPSRVVLSGESLGGWGVLTMASRNPDKFAGVISYCAFAYGLDIQNLSYVPVQIHHGIDDKTCIIDDMRITADDLRKTSNMLSYYEYPGLGHALMGAAQRNHPLSILKTAKLYTHPRKILYTTDQPTRGKCFWAMITRFVDPHYSGTIQLSAGNMGISGTTRNIAGLRLADLRSLFPNAKAINLTIDNQSLKISDTSKPACLARADGKWIVVRSLKQDEYQRGGFMNIFDGNPVVIVAPKGWQQDAETRELIEKCATGVNFGYPAMPFGRIPVVESDTFDAKAFDGHMVLVGGPSDNRVLAGLMSKLPVHIDKDTVVIDGVGQYPLDTTAISLTYKNPYALQRRIVWFHHENKAICPCQPLLCSSSGTYADIIVHDRSHETPVVIAGANYGSDWSLPKAIGDDSRLPKSISTTDDLEGEAITVAMQRLTADFGVYVTTAQWGIASDISGGHLSLTALKALVPAGKQSILRAHLTRDQMLCMMERTKDKGGVKWVSASEPTPVKDYYDVVLIEPVLWTLGCDLGYKFPLGSIVRTDKDAHDFLPIAIRGRPSWPAHVSTP